MVDASNRQKHHRGTLQTPAIFANYLGRSLFELAVEMQFLQCVCSYEVRDRSPAKQYGDTGSVFLSPFLERETKKLIQYLRIAWQETCLSPHMNRRIVKTASQQQVQKEIYQDSSQRWRVFEVFLCGAFDGLKHQP